jgi:dolichol-phosphate mannosyltransferase
MMRGPMFVPGLMAADRLSRMRTLVVIPTFNEHETIAGLAAAITEMNEEFVVLVIDDNSPDGTGSLIQALGQQNPRIRLLSRPSKQGLGSAYVAGFRFGLRNGFARVVTMDADFSHDPAVLESLVNAALGCDVVIGSRYVEGGQITDWSWFRRQLSYTANRLARHILGQGIRDWTSGYCCYRLQAVEKLPFEDIRANGYSFLVEVLAACVSLGCRVTEVPITFADRRVGQSKLSRREIYKGMLTLLRLGVKKLLGRNERWQ